VASYKLCTCGGCKRKKVKRYRVRWRDKAGKQKSLHTETSAQAKQLLAEVERELAFGRNNTDITLNEWAKEVPVTKGNQATKETMQMVWDKHIKDSIGNYKIREISRADINEWLEDDLQGYAPATKRKYLRLVNTALEYAVVDRIIEVNPCKLIHIEGDKRESEPNPLDTEQLYEMIEMWDNDPLLKEHTNFVTALAFTGARPSELSALRWKNVDLKAKELKIRECHRRNSNGSIYLSDRLKSPRARRTLAIPEYLLGRLQFRKDTHPHEEFVFSSVLGNPIHLTNFRERYWKNRFLVNSSLPIEDIYDLRHTFSALMYTTGIDIWELSSMLGHTDPKTTITWYGNWFDKANHSAVEILDDWAKQGITKFGSTS
jgi:integrase